MATQVMGASVTAGCMTAFAQVQKVVLVHRGNTASQEII